MSTTNYGWDIGVAHQDPWMDLWNTLWQNVDTELYKRSKDLYMQGNVIYGSELTGGDLILKSTFHATKGKIYWGARDYYDEVSNSFNDLIAKGPWVDVRSFMDGQAGRPTYATWYAAQDTTDVSSVITAVISANKTILFPIGTFYIPSEITVLQGLSNVRIMGMGYGTILKTNQTNANKIFQLNGTSTNIEFGFLRFLSNFAGTAGNDKAIDLNPCGTNIHIHDCYFETLGSGIFFGDGGSNIKIQHNTFDRVNAGIQHGTGSQATLADISFNQFIGTDSFDLDDNIAISGSVDGVNIFKNQFDQKGSSVSTKLKGHAILVQASAAGGSNNINISENLIVGFDTTHASKRPAVELGVGGAFTFNKIQIINNLFKKVWQGIDVGDYGNDISISGNLISESTDIGIFANSGLHTDDVTISYNIIDTPGNRGIVAQNTPSLLVQGNIVKSSAANGGIWIDNCPNARIINNLSKNNTGAGLLMSASLFAIITENVFTGNSTYGINFSGTGSTNPYLRGNHCNGNTAGQINGYTANSTLADSATPSVRNGNIFLTGGTTTITNLTDGIEGQEIKIISEHAITITDGTNIFLSGSANFVMAATDTLVLIQKADGKWYETGRSDNT